MFQVINQTDFAAALLPALDPDGAEGVLAVVKATYDLRPDGGLHLAECQSAPQPADVYADAPGESGLHLASDLAPEKRGTDVVLVGAAYAPRGAAEVVDVTLEAGPLTKTVRVLGERRWARSALSSSPSKPRPFERMPLVYERAFGGADQTHAKRTEWAFEPRNPIGRGFVANPRREDFYELPLPNLEDPAALITRPSDRPAPTGFGFIAPGWEPRKRHAGTYDEAWLNGRCPLLPADFNPRFYNAAHPDLISKEFFRGGEPVRATNVRQDGRPLQFRLPSLDVRATFVIDGQKTEQPCHLDTVVIEPDEMRLTLTWRAKIRCHRKLKYVTGARMTAVERGA